MTEFRHGPCETETIQIYGLDDREGWIGAHSEGGLPSQSWQYAWALSASGIEPKLAVVRSSGARMLLPFFQREWHGSADIATLLATAGASITPDLAAPLALWRDYAAAQGWVAGYIQLSTSVDLRGQAVAGELVDLNEWFVLDLEAEDLFGSFSEIVRRKVRRGSREGTVLVDDSEALSASLINLFPDSMKRLDARPHYYFPAETLRRWAMDANSLVLGASLGGTIEAVSVFLVSGDQAEYHLNACSERGRGFAAWLIWNAIVRLQAMGVRSLHLGGGVRHGDGLHQFKQKFHGTPRTLHAVRQIYDPARYEELCRQAGVSGSGAWFPAYRAAGNL